MNAVGGTEMSMELTSQPNQFDEIVAIIEKAKSRALKAVNAELIQMYWNVGEYLSNLCTNSNFGDKVIAVKISLLTRCFTIELYRA